VAPASERLRSPPNCSRFVEFERAFDVRAEIADDSFYPGAVEQYLYGEISVDNRTRRL